jgi:hypothetical protein
MKSLQFSFYSSQFTLIPRLTTIDHLLKIVNCKLIIASKGGF